jgi:hypothetical protein
MAGSLRTVHPWLARACRHHSGSMRSGFIVCGAAAVGASTTVRFVADPRHTELGAKARCVSISPTTALS